MSISEDMRMVLRDLQTVRRYGESPKGRNYLFSRYKHEGYVKLTKKGLNIVKVAEKNNNFW